VNVGGTVHTLDQTTLRGASLTISRHGVAPTQENMQVRVAYRSLRGVEVLQNVDIASPMSAGAGPIHDTFSVDNVSLQMAAGESLHFKVTTPAWVTNPTDVRFSGWMLLENTLADTRVTDNDSDISARLVSILANDSDISGILAGDTALLQDDLYAGVLTADEIRALRSVLRLQVADESVILKGRRTTVQQFPNN